MKILKFILAFSLCILLINNIVLGSEIEIPTPPAIPTELTEQNVNLYNEQIQQYNDQIILYNQLQQEQYNQELLEYNDSLIHNQEEDAKVQQIEQANLQEEERVNLINEQKQAEALLIQEEAIKHNEEEDQKVIDNQTALEEQAKIEEKIKAFEEKGLTNSTADAAQLPSDWSTTTTPDAAKTIKVESAEDPTDENYNIMNMHVYLNDNGDNILDNVVNFDENDNLIFSDGFKNSFTLAEWESIEANQNDNVMVISESEPMGYRSAAFYRYMDGYTNGYWIPDYSIFMSTAIDSMPTWYKGAAQEFSYRDGTTDGAPIKNVFSLYAYSFHRTGEEPVKVEKYIPDYWNTDINIEYEKPIYQEYNPNYIIKNNPIQPTYLNTLDYLTYVPPVVEDIPENEIIIEPEVKPEPETIVEPIITDPVIEEEITIPKIEEETDIIEPVQIPDNPIDEIIPIEIDITTTDDIIIDIPVIDNNNIIEENIPIQKEEIEKMEIDIELPSIPFEYDIPEINYIPYTPVIENNNFIPSIDNTSTVEEENEIEMEDYETALGNNSFYDFRGIPILYSPGETGIYVPSNRGIIPISGYLLKR